MGLFKNYLFGSFLPVSIKTARAPTIQIDKSVYLAFIIHLQGNEWGCTSCIVSSNCRTQYLNSFRKMLSYVVLVCVVSNFVLGVSETGIIFDRVLRCYFSPLDYGIKTTVVL